MRPCRVETKHPEVEWEKVWPLAVTHGLPSQHRSFLWQMIHDLLPCQARLFRLRMPNIKSNICTLCDQNSVGDLTHCLLTCSYNDGAGQFLLDILRLNIPNLQLQQVVLLDLDVEEALRLPLIYLTASVLSQVWACRKEKRPCHLASIRAALEAGVSIMRKSRHKEAAKKLSSVLNLA